MPWYTWLIVGLIVVSSLLTVATIGKPREPRTPGEAVAVIIANALLVWGIIAGALH